MATIIAAQTKLATGTVHIKLDVFPPCNFDKTFRSLYARWANKDKEMYIATPLATFRIDPRFNIWLAHTGSMSRPFATGQTWQNILESQRDSD